MRTILSPTAVMQVRKTFLVPRDRVEIQDVTAAPASLVPAGA